MIELLNENALWLGAIGSIAAVIALFPQLFKKNKPETIKKSETTTVTAQNNSIAVGGDVITNSGNTETKKQPDDLDA